MSTLRKIAIMIFLAMAGDAAWACPEACIESITPNPACLGTEMTFKAGSTCTSGGTPRWDFDDGQTAEGMTVTHEYSNINGYLVTLKVTDTDDCHEVATAAYWVAVAGVAKLSAGGVESYTATPGEAETLYVAKGSGAVTITASPLLWWFSWPTGQPQWTGGTAVPDHPEQRALSTGEAGEYTVTATCGDSSKGINVCVVEVSVTADKEGTCVGGNVSFTASTTPSGLGHKTSWTAPGGNPPASTENSQSFTTWWGAAGNQQTAYATVAGVASASASVRVACPVNFQEVDWWEEGTDLYFAYVWESSSGEDNDLTGLRVGEWVDWPDSNNTWPNVTRNIGAYFFEEPMFGWSYNPVVRTNVAAECCYNEDMHESPGFGEPYSGVQVLESLTPEYM